MVRLPVDNREITELIRRVVGSTVTYLIAGFVGNFEIQITIKSVPSTSRPVELTTTDSTGIERNCDTRPHQYPKRSGPDVPYIVRSGSHSRWETTGKIVESSVMSIFGCDITRSEVVARPCESHETFGVQNTDPLPQVRGRREVCRPTFINRTSRRRDYANTEIS